MFYLSNFKNKEDRKKRIAIDISGTALGIQTIRHGLPRALGVRLESHSTSHQKARQILKDGYLDPSKSGGSALAGLDIDLDNNKQLFRESKGNVFITGRHPYRKIDASPIYERYLGGVLRRAYRGSNSFTPEEWKLAVESNTLKNKDPNTFAENFLKGKYRDVQKKTDMGNLPIINHIRGRSLYVGGSDNYFKNNFKPDPDVPFAMMSNKKIKMSGNRLGATVEAIKREGLGNLLKSNTKRVATGLGILGAGGYGTYKLLNRKTRSDKGKTRGKYKK
jgi:hypothetical protein